MIYKLIEIILLSSIWVLGLTVAGEEGMVMYRLRLFCEIQLDKGRVIFKPLFLCVWCMPSIHSVFGYLFAFILGDLNKHTFVRLALCYPVVVMAASFLSGFVWSLYEYVETKKQSLILKTETNENSESSVS